MIALAETRINATETSLFLCFRQRNRTLIIRAKSRFRIGNLKFQGDSSVFAFPEGLFNLLLFVCLFFSSRFSFISHFFVISTLCNRFWWKFFLSLGNCALLLFARSYVWHMRNGIFHCAYATHDIPILAVSRMFVP